MLAASQLTGGDGELSQRFPITAPFLFTRQRSSPLIFLFPLLPSLISALHIFFHVPLLLHFLFRSPFLLYPIFFPHTIMSFISPPKLNYVSSIYVSPNFVLFYLLFWSYCEMIDNLGF